MTERIEVNVVVRDRAARVLDQNVETAKFAGQPHRRLPGIAPPRGVQLLDFELDEEHRIFRDSLRKFLESELRPLDEKWGDEEMVPERARQLTRMLVPWGYLDGRSPFISCIMTEELVRRWLNAVAGHKLIPCHRPADVHAPRARRMRKAPSITSASCSR